VEEFQNSQDINEILDEFLNQSLIWVDDDSGRGKVIWFKKLLKTLDDHEDLLTLCNELEISLNIQEVPRIGPLPNGLNQILRNTFQILGWTFARQFLNRLGLRQCQLHAIEDEIPDDFNKRFQNGLDQYIAQVNNDPENSISTTTDFYSHVISTLQDLRLLKVVDQIENAGFLPLM